MKFHKAIVHEKISTRNDVTVYRLVPENGVPRFTAGQYCFLINPSYYNSAEPHPFSIASSPNNKKYLEFCIKTYGNWTRRLSEKRTGENVYISEPVGNFLWDENISNPVFILGGIGISPVISMLRTIRDSKKKPESITVLYGNRTPDTVAYLQELNELEESIPQLKVFHIFSHISSDHPWNGYRGFIGPEILEEEVDFEAAPTFFIVGPPVFVMKMKQMLSDERVGKEHIKEELLENVLLSTQGRFA